MYAQYWKPERMGEGERGRKKERHFLQAPQLMADYREPHWVHRII